jgi:hypothetical protein
MTGYLIEEWYEKKLSKCNSKNQINYKKKKKPNEKEKKKHHKQVI